MSMFNFRNKAQLRYFSCEEHLGLVGGRGDRVWSGLRGGI